MLFLSKLQYTWVPLYCDTLSKKWVEQVYICGSWLEWEKLLGKFTILLCWVLSFILLFPFEIPTKRGRSFVFSFNTIYPLANFRTFRARSTLMKFSFSCEKFRSTILTKFTFRISERKKTLKWVLNVEVNFSE